ncbi:MAG: 50S ribosomal protein L3 [bacterium]|nr:50S ribosomal protein L3 [bacterium]
MNGFILGTKTQATQEFTPDGKRVPVTMIKTTPCYVVGIKQKETDGYTAIIIGYGTTKHMPKPTKGLLDKAGIKTPLRFLRELRIEQKDVESTLIEEEGKRGFQFSEKKLFVGDEIKPSEVFGIGTTIQVTGISKGKGFAGVVKRHGFGGSPSSHGHPAQRTAGSIGATTTPGRVFKGKRMAGRMGSDRVTVQNLKVFAADETSIKVTGLIPGHIGGLVEVKA